MSIRYKSIFLSILMGLICPAIVISFVRKEGTPPDFRPEVTNITEQTKGISQEISVLMPDGSIRLMDINEYLTCVVLREMPADFEEEALKAQAVVARTYALRRKHNGGKHPEAAVCTDSDCCQGYYDPQAYIGDGGKNENVEKINRAVIQTDQLVLVYGGKLIDATYFSCSGGMTEDAKAVWGADIPYLQSTESPGEESAKHYVDTVTFTVAEFLKRLDMDNTDAASVGDITYTAGGGVDTIRIAEKVFKGTDIRKKLDLRSTAFAITVIGNTVKITTKGFGHRVGMSQYGADAMAVSGAKFPEILAHYYQGTQLVMYNDN